RRPASPRSAALLTHALSRLEAHLLVRPVAEGLVRRLAAAAEIDRVFVQRVLRTLEVDEIDRPGHLVGAVSVGFHCDVRHGPSRGRFALRACARQTGPPSLGRAPAPQTGKVAGSGIPHSTKPRTLPAARYLLRRTAWRARESLGGRSDPYEGPPGGVGCGW